MDKCFITILTLIVLCRKHECKYVEGILKSKSNWEFLAKFCFNSEQGTLEYEFEYSEIYTTQSFLLYWDEPDAWNVVYRSNTSCLSKEKMSQHAFHLNINFPSFCVKRPNSTYEIQCRSTLMRFDTIRPRWWFFTISNCHDFKGLEVKYRLWMRNGSPGDIFFEHFSADEFYILQTDMLFLLAQFILLLLSIIMAAQLKKKRMLHSTYRMFMLSLMLQLLHLLIMCITYGIYANTGVVNDGLKYFGESLNSLAHINFVLMLLLLGLGYTVIFGKLPTFLVCFLAVFVLIHGLAYVIVFLVEHLTFDPGWVLYRYESSAGLGLVALQLLAWIYFVAACVYTSFVHKNKRAFYIPLLIFYTMWFWATPIMIFVGINHIPLWMKEKVVNATHLSIVYCGQLFYLILTRPSSANKNFPFHLNTSKIDAITIEMAKMEANSQFSNIEGTRNFTDFSIFSAASNENFENVAETSIHD